jgi:hypothetical protein
MTAQAQLRDGLLQLGMEVLRDEGEWLDATAELQAWRCGRLAEAAWLLRDFALAERVIEQAQALCLESTLARKWLGPHIALLAPRMAYARDPSHNWRSVQRAVTGQIGAMVSLDRLQSGLSLNQLALCARREMEHKAQDLGDHRGAHEALGRSLSAGEAAVWCFATAEMPIHAQAASANLGHALARARTLGVLTDAQPAFAWFGVAQTWTNRFDLPEDSTWDYVFVGDLYLYGSQPGEFGSAGRHQGWEELQPDCIDFYTTALKRAQAIAEPRQLLHCTLNLWQFCLRHGAVEMAARTRTDLSRLLAQHADLHQSLQREGYPLPQPARAAAKKRRSD